ncbi:MAG: hypothetical protein ABW046_22550 [Actinoplanes sp.]
MEKRVSGTTGAVLLTSPPQHWHCGCGRSAVTKPGEADARLHHCSLVGGLLVPYAPADSGTVKVTATLREDYERHAAWSPSITETLARDDAGRPHMRTTIEYGDGHQVHNIFVPGIGISMRGGGA